VAVGGHSLAEDGEGVSEARPGGEAEEIRPRRYVVDSQSETIRPKEGGWRRKCRSFVSARGVKPHTGVGGDFWSVGGGVYQIMLPIDFAVLELARACMIHLLRGQFLSCRVQRKRW
jgi:hypothetical protein